MPFLRSPLSFLFLGMSKASYNSKAAMKKKFQCVHSVFSHVGPRPFSFLHHSSKHSVKKTLMTSIEVAIF